MASASKAAGTSSACGATGKRENWLLIKEIDQDAIPGSNNAFLEGLASSVTTGPSMEEIAGGAAPAQKRKSNPKTAATLKRLMDMHMLQIQIPIAAS